MHAYVVYLGYLIYSCENIVDLRICFIIPLICLTSRSRSPRLSTIDILSVIVYAFESVVIPPIDSADDTSIVMNLPEGQTKSEIVENYLK